jgi:hypothetical protein
MLIIKAASFEAAFVLFILARNLYTLVLAINFVRFLIVNVI